MLDVAIEKIIQSRYSLVMGTKVSVGLKIDRCRSVAYLGKLMSETRCLTNTDQKTGGGVGLHEGLSLIPFLFVMVMDVGLLTEKLIFFLNLIQYVIPRRRSPVLGNRVGHDIIHNEV